ncbi:DUF4148 domain-containing protein [Paraburkholderia antibiotica]|uniref:DUF4148 domain-containing protein n=1 Tax=Paraburkholderia antibiotica TaxID=2728839 RepID=A0A7X9X6T5_9BURK|nr:DUF4148 domain-containing protein [Paraburkholderia antibiotica]NML32501.1 DUF4148 domain-containing protein [Paraburkholderia antibiotica]
MKLVQSLLVAALVVAPVASFAQSPQHPLSRADVRAELVQLQKAGYNPASDNTQYPQNIEAAEARIGAANSVASGAAAGAYGGVEQGRSASGSPVPMKHVAVERTNDGSNVIGLGSIYAHS